MLLHVESKTNREHQWLAQYNTTTQTNKKVRYQDQSRQDKKPEWACWCWWSCRTEEEKEGEIKTDRPGLARQAGKQACSLSELEGRPPTSALTPPGRRGENVTPQCRVILWYPYILPPLTPKYSVYYSNTSDSRSLQFFHCLTYKAFLGLILMQKLWFDMIIKEVNYSL